METLDVMIEQAIKADACKKDISHLKNFKNLDDLIKNVNDQQKAFWAYWYAENVIKGRWEEGEPIIMKNLKWAFFYAENVIEGR